MRKSQQNQGGQEAHRRSQQQDQGPYHPRQPKRTKEPSSTQRPRVCQAQGRTKRRNTNSPENIGIWPSYPKAKKIFLSRLSLGRNCSFLLTHLPTPDPQIHLSSPQTQRILARLREKAKTAQTESPRPWQKHWQDQVHDKNSDIKTIKV